MNQALRVRYAPRRPANAITPSDAALDTLDALAASTALDSAAHRHTTYQAPFHCLDPNHRVRVRVGVRVHEKIRYVRAQYGPQLSSFA